MKEWIRRYYKFRYIYSRLVINIVSNHPLTAILVPLLFIGEKNVLYTFLSLSVATIYTESNLTSISYILVQYQCYQNFKKHIFNHMFGKLEPIYSDLINRFVETAIKVEGNPFHNYFKPILYFYRASEFQDYTTFPIYPRTTVTILKSTFDEDSSKDRTALAHECGHAFHSKIRNKKLAITAAFVLLLILMVLYALCYNNWWGFLIILFFAYPIFIDIFRYKADIETEADHTGLKIIELLYGVHEMRKAAKHLATVRIEEARVKGNRLSDSTLKPSILLYLHLLDAKDLYELKEDAYTELYFIRTSDEDISTKREKYKFEQWLIDILKGLWFTAAKNESPAIDSSLKFRYYKHILYIVCVSLGLFIPAILTYIVFSNPDNLATLNSHFFLVAYLTVITINIILSIIIYFLKTKLWKKIESVFNQIGN